MKQGYSGSTVKRTGNLVQKTTTDRVFMQSSARKQDLVALSQKLDILPRIYRIDEQSIFMDYVDGCEGLTEQNARQAGKALRRLHEVPDYQHPCIYSVHWLITLANNNLARMNYHQRVSTQFETEYTPDALIHSEPVQLIEKQDGSIVFIDFEGIGMGTRYQDLGYIYYTAIKQDSPKTYSDFLEGYQPGPGQIETVRVIKLAGLISLAYAGFAESEKRTRLGLQLLTETGAL
jgi:hypothetical protein